MAKLFLLVYLFVPLASLTSDLDSLQQALDNKSKYDAQKLHQLDSLRAIGNNVTMAKVYCSYCYDSAIVYAKRAVEDAKIQGDVSQLFDNNLRLASVYMSGGRFVECTKLFDSMNLEDLDVRRQSTYYSQRARLLYDISRYQNTPFLPQMRDYYERAFLLWPGDSLNTWNLKAQLAVCDGDMGSALDYTNRSLLASKDYPHSQAIFSCAMAQIYLEKGDSAEALHHFIGSAIYDLKSSTKEIIAMQQVAQLLFHLGETDMANRCIRSALADANLHGARHRQLEVGEILPIIDQYQIDLLRERNRRERILYSCIVVLLCLGSIALGGAYHRKNELNKIQKNYLTAMLTLEAEHTEALERYQKHVMRCAREGDTKGLLQTPGFIRNIGQRTQFYKRFDAMFLHLYPKFVEQVNKYVREPFVNEKDVLPCELRVFALMRLGVTDNNEISRVLSYSVSTIHTYKARVYSILKCDKETFLEILELKK